MAIDPVPSHSYPQGPKETLEAELGEVLKQIRNVRNRKLVARHLGWDGRPPGSLKEAGARHQLTRERARQVFAEALPLLGQSRDVPTLDAVLVLIQQHRQELAGDVEEELQRVGLTSRHFPLEGILRAAQVLRRAPVFQLHEIGGSLFVGPVRKLALEIRNRAVKVITHNGVARVSQIRHAVSTATEKEVSERLVQQILRTRDDLVWLDERGEWFWFSGLTRNRLVNRIQKVLAVRPKIPLSDLHRAISRGYEPLALPEPVLRSLCTRLPWCRIQGPNVFATGARPLEHILSGGEAIVCRILRAHGRAMSLSQLQARCSAEGVKKPNLWRVLSFSPLISRFDREVYGLIGSSQRAGRTAGRHTVSLRSVIDGMHAN